MNRRTSRTTPPAQRPSAALAAPAAPGLRRRHGLAALIGLPAVLIAPAALAQPLRPTPSQTEGPFYPVRLPEDSDADLLRNGSRTLKVPPALLEGRVTDLGGRPLRGGVVEIWQCDGQGHYHHPGDGDRADPDFQGFGRCPVDAEGGYRFRTLRPVAYGSRTPHIHLKVKLGPRDLLTTQVYVQGDPGNERDFLWRRLGEADRALITVPFERQAEGWRARFAIAVQA